MSVPWAKRLSGRADVYGFPVTNGPLMLLLPNRAGVPIYGQPRPTVVMMQPPVAVIPPLPPPPPAPRPPVQPITVTYQNQAQTCVNTCPPFTIGAPISVTIQAGQPEFDSDVSQDDANAAAMAAACAQAAAEREASPCVSAEFPCSSECRSTSLTATLIGCPEFTGMASVPPRKYRRFYLTGTSEFQFYVADDTCMVILPGTAGILCIYTKWLQYDAITGATTTGGATTCINLLNPDINPDIDTSPLSCYTGGLPAPSCDSFWTLDSPTVLSRHATGDCCANQRNVQDNLQNLLGDEDTEEDAEYRAMLASGPVWTTGNCTDNTATRETRGAGDFTFAFRAAQFRVTIGSGGSPLTPGNEYAVTVEIGRRVLGSSDPYTPHSEIEFNLEAEGTTQQSDWIDIPNAAGFETAVTGCSALGQ